MRQATLLITLTLLVAACGSKGPGDTPEQTFYAFRNATLDHDWRAMWDLFAPSRKAEAKKDWQPDGDLRKEIPEIMEDLGKSREEIEAMTLPELYVAGAQHRYEVTRKRDAEKFDKRMNQLREAEIIEVDKFMDGEAKVIYKLGERKGRLRVILENGKWYIDKAPF